MTIRRRKMSDIGKVIKTIEIVVAPEERPIPIKKPQEEPVKVPESVPELVEA
jgi:hypothetical protein